MKIVYQNVICLLFFIAYNYSLAKDEPVEMDIVGFFHDENSQAKVAFETAVYNTRYMQEKMVYSAESQVIPPDASFESSVKLCDLTERKKIGAVFTPKSIKTASILESICRNLEIPVIHTDWSSIADYQGGVALNFYPYPRLLHQGLGVIVRHLQWRSIVIFYERTASLIRLQDILQIQNFNPSMKFDSIIVKKLGPGPDYRSVLKEIQNKSEHRIIVDCKTDKIMDVLIQAKGLGLLDKPYNYFLTSLDAHTLNFTVLNTEANITTVRIMDPYSKNLQNAVVRWKNYIEEHYYRYVHLDPFSVKTETALMSDAVTTYLSATEHLSETNDVEPRNFVCHDNDKWPAGLPLASFLKVDKMVRPLDIITGPIDFDELGRRTNFVIYVVEGNQENVVATWHPDDPQTLHFRKSEEDRNKELEEKWRSKGMITVASIIGPPYLMHADNQVGEVLEGNKRYRGFSKDLMDELTRKLNISYQLNVLPSGQRGSYDKDTKSWNGLIREILDRRAELAICDLTITPERREAVDFSTPFMRLGISILYKKEEPKEADMYAFLDPLHFDLWMYSATLYLATTVALFFITRLSPPDWENPHPCEPEPEELENIWNIKNCLWLTLGSIMNQGCDILPKGICSRMVASMWWFFTIIVTNSYMANLAAFLTTGRSQSNINSADELAMQTKVKYGTLEGGSTQAFFRDSNYSIYQRMWTNMQQSRPSVFENSNEAGVARVLNAKNRLYAFLMESATLEYQVERNCNLTQVGNWLDSKSYGIAMPLDYPHRSRINEALLQLQEKGVINKLKDYWWKQNGTKCDSEFGGGSSNKLSLQNVGGVFMVLAVGIGLAYVAAICEFLWNVRNVSVEEHISFWQAFKIEAKFALNVTVTKKKVKRQASSVSRSRSRTRSRSRSMGSRGLARSILHGAGSFLRLDVLGRGETPGSSRHTSRPLD